MGQKREKTYKQTISLISGHILTTTPPLGIGLTSISNVKRVMCTQFPIMGELHLTSVSIFHDMICPLKFASKNIVCVVGGDAGGGGSEQHVCKVILVISLSLSQAEQ